MNISPFFLQLRSAYQAELDDLTSDSEGKDVLRKRLVEKRKELGFLIQMIEVSPEMVAVILHQGFRFKLPAVMDHLLSHEADELPDWDTFADAIQLTPASQEVAQEILKQPMGAWFMTVAAGLEYMYGKPGLSAEQQADDQDDESEDEEERLKEFDADEEEEARVREEAGANWMEEQGFDRKD